LRLHIDILRAPTLIIVAEERVSSKLWHGRKDDEYLGFWDTFVPSAFRPSAARNLSISLDKKKLAKPRLLVRTGPSQGTA
jgi:hypothetical protein